MIFLQKITVILFCMFLLGLAGNNTNPVCAKSAAQKTAEVKTKSTSVVKAATAMVDLAVERIWLDGHCLVNFQLKNSGKDTLDPKAHGALRLRVQMGKEDSRMRLAEVDPKGALVSPGGSVNYATRLKVEEVAQVTVELEAAPDEINPQNNKRRQTLVGSCRQEAVKTEFTRGQSDKTAELPTASKKVEEDKIPTRTLPVSRQEPFISLEDIYLKDNKVFVVIRNQGEEPISPQMAVRGRLKVQLGKQQLSWSLQQLDPLGSRLNRGKKELHFDTGLVLKESDMVLAELFNVSGTGITVQKKRLVPQDTGKTKSAPVMTAAQARTEAVRRKGREAVKGPVMMATKDDGPGKKGPATHMGAVLDLPQGQGLEMVPLFQDRGIVISEPAASSDVRRGGSVRVTYTVVNSAAVGGSSISFSLHRPMTPGMDDYGSEPVATISHRHALQDTNQDIPHSFFWPLPEDIAVADDYIIRARLNDDVWGESHQFYIRDLLDREAPRNPGMVLDHGIVISEPAPSSDVRRGTSVRVTYTVADSAAVGGSNITFSLYPPMTPGNFNYGSEPVATISHRHALQDTNQDIPHSFFWPLPEDVPVSVDYIMRARLNEDVWGESRRFNIRHLFDPEEANHSGEENGIEIIYPEGGETFRPGGTMPFRWIARSTATADLDNMDIQLLAGCEHQYSYRPSIVSGDPGVPNLDSVLRLPEDIAHEGLYCLYARDRDDSWPTGYSRTFEIRRQSGSFGEGAGSGSTATEPQLQVLSPGTGGEHWRVNSEHPITWRFYPGVEATLPGTWTITLYRYDPSSGYSPAHTFVAETYDVRQVVQGGLTWYEYTYNWDVQAFSHSDNDSEYKIGVSAMGYHDQGSLNFTIRSFSEGSGWNLKISDVKVENMQLIAMVENQSEQDEGGVSGRLDFSVEVGGTVRQVTASAPPQTERSHSEPVVLGQLNNLVADLSQFECAIPVRVTVDSTDRVEETDEEDNVFSGEVYSSNRALSINLRLPYGDSTFNGAEVQCGVDANDSQMIAMIELKNCGTIAVSGNIRVTQSGWWSSSEPGTLSGPSPATWHDEETILNRSASVGPTPGDLSGSFPTLDTDTTYIPVQVLKRHLRRDYQGRIVDSAIHIYFEGNFGSYALHNPWNLLLDVVE